MSYALGATPSRANTIRLGSLARKDVIFARASYEASSILLRSMKKPRAQRVSYIESQLRRYYAGSKQRFVAKRQELMSAGTAPRQATFDAMRLIIANHYAQLGMEAIQAAIARTHSAEALGDRDAELVGCAITGGVTAIGGFFASLYGGPAGGGAVGTGGQLVGQVLDCGKEEREALLELQQEQNKQTELQIRLAELEADEGGGGSFDPMSSTTKKVLAASAGVLVLLVVGFVIVKV